MLLLSLGLAAQLGAALPTDSVDSLHERARGAEARFERLSRQLAPFSWSGGPTYDCDEIVGRFCLLFDSTTARPESPEGEAARIVDARREAVEAVRRYFAAAPRSLEAAGPLVRLLIRDGRPGEAASAAAAFSALSGDTVWGELLQGFAHHAGGDGMRAERHFVAGLSRLDAAGRAAWVDPAWLLHPDERRHERRLSPDARTDYQRRFWLVADPLWLTPENERWNEHVARGVEARLMASVPVVAGMMRWGRDLDELTVRYGTPTARARQRATTTGSDGMVEYWDSAQRAYAPARFSEGLGAQPSPGERPLLYAATARSAYAMRSVDRVVELSHQVTRFMRGDTVVLRVDAAMPAAHGRGAPPRTGLFVYDSAFTRRVAATGHAAMHGDTARLTLFAEVPAGPLVYSAEISGDSMSPAGRARYALDAAIPSEGPVVSDLLIARPFEPSATPSRRDDARLRAHPSLVLAPGDTIGLYAEIYRLAGTGPISIEVSLESAERPSLLGRLAGWVGRTVGVTDPAADPRVGWHGDPDGSRYHVALNIPLPADRRGMHDLVLYVIDPATGERAERRRRILLR